MIYSGVLAHEHCKPWLNTSFFITNSCRIVLLLHPSCQEYNSHKHNIYWLVVLTILKKMISSVRRMTSHILWKIKIDPNHQPVYLYIYILYIICVKTPARNFDPAIAIGICIPCPDQFCKYLHISTAFQRHLDIRQ